MSEDRTRGCGIPDGDLIDLAWGKLDPARETEVFRHTMGCAECTAELEALKATRESVGDAADAAPSRGFRERLMERVREGARRATPASGIHAAGSATRRYAKIVERERSARSWIRPRWKLLVLATAAAASLSAVLLSRLWVFDRSAPVSRRELVEASERRRRAVFGRYAERKDCARRVKTEIRDGRLDLGPATGGGEILGEIAGEEEIILAGVADPDQHESCLMAFRAADWETFSLRHRGSRDARFEAIAGSRRVVPVRDGRIEIPEDLLARHVGGMSVVILKLRDHAEIWSPKTLETYIGLPPLWITIEDVTLAPAPRDARKS